MTALAITILLAAAAAASGPGPTATREAATPVTAYELRLDLRPDGSADVALTLHVAASGSQTVRVPFPWSELTEARLATAPPSSTYTVTPSGERATLSVDLPMAPSAPLEIRLIGRVKGVVSEPGPAGRSMRLAMMNVEPATLPDLTFLIAFPEGWRAHAIREALPKAGKSDAAPRAVLQFVDGRPGVRLHADALVQGEAASLRIDLAPTSRSPGWLIAGLALAALYLRSFRDLTASMQKQKDPP